MSEQYFDKYRDDAIFHQQVLHDRIDEYKARIAEVSAENEQLNTKLANLECAAKQQDKIEDLERKISEYERDAKVWKPIETAPRDGTSILGYREGKNQVIVFWYYNSGWHCDASYHSIMLPPTHWMPLPNVPGNK